MLSFGVQLMVFESRCNSLSGSIATWAFSGRARHVTQDHPVYIPRDLNCSVSCRRGRLVQPRCCSRCCLVSAACLCASGRAWLVHADLGDGRPDPSLAERAGDGDAMVPVEHVVPAAAVVEVDWVHAATTSDVGGYPLKARSRQLRGGPEMAVKAQRRLDRSDDVIDRHGCLAGQSMAACAGDDRHLT